MESKEKKPYVVPSLEIIPLKLENIISLSSGGFHGDMDFFLKEEKTEDI